MNETERQLTIHAFASAKGGVGKSTLSVALARILDTRGRTTIVLDADFTGTSLGDGLALECPESPAEAPDLNLAQPPRGPFASAQDTWLRRQLRRAERNDEPPRAGPRHLPYFNDLLEASTATPWAWGWRLAGLDRTRFFPSSPVSLDIDRAAQWSTEPGRWHLAQDLWNFIVAAASERPDLTDVIVDLPPGFYLTSHAVLTLLAELERGKDLPAGFAPRPPATTIRTRPHIICTSDMNDLTLAIEGFVERRPQLRTLDVVLNRTTMAPAALSKRVADVFRPEVGDPYRVWDLVRSQIIPEDPNMLGFFDREARATSAGTDAVIARVLGVW